MSAAMKSTNAGSVAQLADAGDGDVVRRGGDVSRSRYSPTENAE